LTEQIAMLQVMSRGQLHLGLGRGTAKQEYDAFGLDMAEARGRFKEIIEIIRLGLSGERFSYHGEYYQINHVRVRPQIGDRKPYFYGAIGSLESATIMAELDLSPLCLLTFPEHLLQKILLDWELSVRAHGGDISRPKALSAKLYMADTDEEARELARQYMPAYFALQLDHYEAEADHWLFIPGYEHHSKGFANLRKLTDPTYQERYFDMQFIGTADTVAAKVAKLQALGFTYITVGTGTPYVPRSVRHDMLRRFAEEVVPRFAGNTVRSAAEA
jgi:alkanesulfonate monooxygenase SsuD/methylene tetrahydromethanopterin reductase-like flavin-dependent oxidoreductase (luciferase family)